MREPLKPFSFGAPYNINEKSTKFSKPEDTLDYENHFGYIYDELSFAGLNPTQIEDAIKERKVNCV